VIVIESEVTVTSLLARVMKLEEDVKELQRELFDEEEE